MVYCTELSRCNRNSYCIKLFDILHLHDFDAITFLHLSILMQETSMADAITTSHQNNFDAITLLHLSILMQETMNGWCNSELSHRSLQTDATRLLHLELLHRLASNTKLMQYQAMASILALLHQNFVGATGSKISSGATPNLPTLQPLCKCVNSTMFPTLVYVS
jgi:hypothetical protein